MYYILYDVKRMDVPGATYQSLRLQDSEQALSGLGVTCAQRIASRKSNSKVRLESRNPPLGNNSDRSHTAAGAAAAEGTCLVPSPAVAFPGWRHAAAMSRAGGKTGKCDPTGDRKRLGTAWNVVAGPVGIGEHGPGRAFNSPAKREPVRVQDILVSARTRKPEATASQEVVLLVTPNGAKKWSTDVPQTVGI